MSDTSQGEGWWLASDGKWYPPESKPLYVPPPPPSWPGARPGPGPSGQPAGWPASPAWAPYPGGTGLVGYPPAYAQASTGAVPMVDQRTGLVLAPWWKRLVAILIDGLALSAGLLVESIILGIANVGFGWWILTSLTLGSLYYAILNGSAKGQTLGKRAMAIACRNARHGGPIGFWRGLARCLVWVVFDAAIVIPYVLDNLSPLWDKRRQAWHDHIVRSLVIDIRP